MGKFYNSIMGFVVGDALGVPYEFRKRGTFLAKDMIGHGTYNQPVGTWSDDTSLTLATIDSLLCRGRIDLGDIMYKFSKWFYEGKYTPHGNVFDVGHTTRKAIENYADHLDPKRCGGYSVNDNGNGSLMRILPLAFLDCSFYEIYSVSALTHGHIISEIACELYVLIARNLIEGKNISDAIKEATSKMGFALKNNKEFHRIPKIGELHRKEIKSTGYVVDTLEAALWCLLTTNSYKDCVITAVNLGDDTDTIAAVAGGLAGIIYGVGGNKGIPEEWISKIAQKSSIEKLCVAFEKKH